MPLGAGALAGVNFDTDRRMVAAELGFDGVARELDRLGLRPRFALDFLSALGNLFDAPLEVREPSSSLVSSQEFGFCEMSDAWSSGSSIMPQKKNPDAAELLRAKAPRVVGHLAGLARGHPRTAADLQQGPAGGQGAPLRLVRHARAEPRRRRRRWSRPCRFDRERMGAAAADELVAATDVADLLVGKGLPFREAHGVVAGLVRTAVESGRQLGGLTRRGASGRVAAAPAGVLRPARSRQHTRVEALGGWHRSRSGP